LGRNPQIEDGTRPEKHLILQGAMQSIFQRVFPYSVREKIPSRSKCSAHDRPQKSFPCGVSGRPNIALRRHVRASRLEC
jgi:hypothetical protein